MAATIHPDPTFSDHRIQKRYEELKLCQEITRYFLHQKPWADEYLKTPRLIWYLFLQARFPDLQGQWTNPKNSKFLEEIESRVESEIRDLGSIQVELEPNQELPPSLPPNLKQLVEEFAEAQNKKNQAEKIEKEVWHFWELARNRNLLKQDLQPSFENTLVDTSKELDQVINSMRPKIPGLRTIDPHHLSHLLSTNLSQQLQALKIEERRTLSTDTDESLHLTRKIFKTTLQSSLDQARFKKEVAAEIVSQSETLLSQSEIEKIRSKSQQHLQSQDLYSFQQNHLKSLELQKIIQDTATQTGSVPDKASRVVQNAKNYLSPAEAENLRTPLQAFFSAPQDQQADAKQVLDDSLSQSFYQQASREVINLQAAAQLQRFVYQTLESIDNLEELVGLPNREFVDKYGHRLTPKQALSQDITSLTLYLTADSQNLHLFTLSNDELTATIKEVLRHAFSQKLLYPSMSNVFSAVKNSIPTLRSQKAKNAFQLLETNIFPQIENLPPSIISFVKTATANNFSASNFSIENGDPLGRIPTEIRMQILGTNPDQLDLYLESLLQQEHVKLSPSQINTVKQYLNFLKQFSKTNPAIAGVFQFWGKHYRTIPLAKSVVRYFLAQPDYILHLPPTLFKLWIRNKYYLKWQNEWKPALLDNVIKTPGLGSLVNFLYKRNSWGIYEGPWHRLKKKVKTSIVRRSLQYTGRFLRFAGQKLGIKALESLGEKILGSLLTGGAGTLFFAAYPLFKDTLKKIFGFFSLAFLSLLYWAYTHAAAGLAGFITGNVLGGIAGVKVGSLVFGATAPFLGPFAIVPAVLAGGLTWLATTGAITWLFITLQDLGKGVLGWGKSALGSLSGAVADSLALHEGVSAAGLTSEIAGTAGKILVTTGLAISGLYFYTQLVNTSSLLPPTGLEYLAGSKYIELQKGVQVGEEDDKDQFKDHYSLPNDICDSPAKTVYYQIGVKVSKDLTDIKITDKTSRTGEYGSVSIQEKSWEIGDLGKGETWESEVYSFTLTPDFKDSYLSNTVTVITAEGEEKTATLTLKIGNPPAPPLKDAVELLIDTLISCYQTHQINKATLTDNGQCLLEKQIPQSAVDVILKSVRGYTNLQCVGLVIGATQMAGQPLESHDAVDYYGKDFGNWHWHSNLEMNNIREGDVFVSAKYPGHLAVVDFVNTDGFRLAEAFGNSCTQEGPYATLCAGYVRYQDGTFITFHQTKDRGEIGFLRWGE